jgi:hypothetical protein
MLLKHSATVNNPTNGIILSCITYGPSNMLDMERIGFKKICKGLRYGWQDRAFLVLRA